MKLSPILLSISLAVAPSLRADPQGMVGFDYPQGTAKEAMELYAILTDAHVVFREEKEMQRIVPITTKKSIKYSEARELIVQRCRLEGLEIRKVEEGVFEVVRTLSEEVVRRLNKEAGREWKGPQYKAPSKLPHVRRGHQPEPRVRYEPKKKGAQDGAKQAPASPGSK